jgi:hypothetical protein
MIPRSWMVIEWVTKNLLSRILRASEGTLSRWSRLHFNSLAPTLPHWARSGSLSYDSFSLCDIHKEDLCPSSGGVNWLMTMSMMMTYKYQNTIQD